MLDFASDSYGIIWSSGVLDGPDGHTAPDLWRYVPGRDQPDLLWRNPDRDRQLAKIGGDTDVWAFAEISAGQEGWWKLWLLSEADGSLRMLDSEAEDSGVPSLVPSFDVDAGRIAWTAFHRGAQPGSATSQLWMAQAPEWEPRLLAKRDAADHALWLPSLYGDGLAYVEVTIGADPSLDIRHVMLLDLSSPTTDAVQLDTSGNATMPVMTDDGVVWKEPEVGFAMFNWGTLRRYAFDTGTVSGVRMMPQVDVNYPSGGGRFLAAWGANTSVFTVHDLHSGRSRLIELYDNTVDSIVRPHLAGDLLVWMHRTEAGAGLSPPAPLEYAWLPERGRD